MPPKSESEVTRTYKVSATQGARLTVISPKVGFAPELALAQPREEPPHEAKTSILVPATGWHPTKGEVVNLTLEIPLGFKILNQTSATSVVEHIVEPEVVALLILKVVLVHEPDTVPRS